MEKKITKREMFEAIKTGCTTGEWTVSDVEIAEFCDNEIALLDKKAIKAKERAAEKSILTNLHNRPAHYHTAGMAHGAFV